MVKKKKKLKRKSTPKPKKKSSSSKKGKKKKLVIGKDSIALEIYLEGGIITAIRCQEPLAYRIIDMDLAEDDEAPVVAVGNLIEGGKTSTPSYVPQYLKDHYG